MTAAEMEAIAGGYHGDPFSILGPHPGQQGKTKPWEVRAFLPQASAAGVVSAAQPIAMKKQHEQGFFTAVLPTRPEAYKLRIHPPAGTADIEDPYRFPPITTEFDL